jgi:hypothetical protein
VSVRDGPDDREPEAAAAGGRRVPVAAGEALEHPLAHRLRHARPAVCHFDHRARPLAAYRHRHGRAGRRVDERVLDQVARQAVKVVFHAAHHHRAGQVERERVLG